MKKLKTALQSKKLFKIITTLIVILSIIITKTHKFKSKINQNQKKFTGQVTSIKIDKEKLTITLKEKENIITNYYFKSKKEKNYYQKNLHLGDILTVKGTLKKPENNTLPNNFNYKKYLYNKHIYYILTVKNIKKKENNTSISYYIKNKIITRINKIDKTGYLNTFIIGDKSKLNIDIKESYQSLGISHLFAISGMHISFITTIMLFILNKISYNTKYKYSIIIFFLLFYLFLTNYSPSILRTTIMFILSAINKSFNLKISKIDLALITLDIICIIDAFILYDIGFQFSYITSFFIIIFGNKINNYKNNILKSLYTSYICFLSSLPICIYYFNEINILSIIFNLLMIPIISLIIFPLSIITLIIPQLSNIYYIIINILEKIIKTLNSLNVLSIIIQKPNYFIIILTYISIIISILNKKNIPTLIIIILYLKTNPYLDNSFIITIIDVGQGDSILIQYKNNKETIMIDTGGIVNTAKESYKYTKQKTIPYLKSLGLNKVSTLLLSHGDFDHMGEAVNLVNNFKVEKVIFNCGPYNNLEKDLIKVLNKKKIKYYSCIKELNIDKNKLYFLQTKEYDNENDNSNVIYTELNGYKFLFMGDASTTTEKEILDKYNLSNIDVLKVGHHGSRTSSSKEFINEINPNYSIISVGKNNRYGHPNKEVLEILNESKIYRTDQDGSIMFKIKNNKLKIETCSP